MIIESKSRKRFITPKIEHLSPRPRGLVCATPHFYSVGIGLLNGPASLPAGRHLSATKLVDGVYVAHPRCARDGCHHLRQGLLEAAIQLISFLRKAYQFANGLFRAFRRSDGCQLEQVECYRQQSCAARDVVALKVSELAPDDMRRGEFTASMECPMRCATRLHPTTT